MLSRPEAIRIDRFVEKRFGITAEYQDLEEGVLGYTTFGPKGPIAVVISRSLDEEGTAAADRRVRTTLAHEAGHILLQGHLFSLPSGTGSLFPIGAGVTATQVLCRQETAKGRKSEAGYGYDGRWWEYQANRAIGALLLPRPLVLILVEPFLSAQGSLGIKGLDPKRRGEAEVSVAEAFDVNRMVARLRLEEIWPAGGDSQLRL
ncbi:MAG: hypothetical protein ACRD88_14565 [Terriglobia bacterium]